MLEIAKHRNITCLLYSFEYLYISYKNTFSNILLLFYSYDRFSNFYTHHF